MCPRGFRAHLPANLPGGLTLVLPSHPSCLPLVPPRLQNIAMYFLLSLGQILTGAALGAPPTTGSVVHPKQSIPGLGWETPAGAAVQGEPGLAPLPAAPHPSGNYGNCLHGNLIILGKYSVIFNCSAGGLAPAPSCIPAALGRSCSTRFHSSCTAAFKMESKEEE